jgi:hypothetical protein
MGHLQPVPMNRGATVARDAILCVKLWKSLVCRDTGQKHYFPSYLIELIAIKCQLEEPHQLVTVGVMFAHVLTRIANHEHMMIDFVHERHCEYEDQDLGLGLPNHRSPSVADPGNPTNDMARPTTSGIIINPTNDIARPTTGRIIIDWPFWKRQAEQVLRDRL